MIDVDVVIPSYSGYSELRELIESFKSQENINIKNIIIPITEACFGNDYNLIKYCDENNITYFKVKKEDFSHSLIREKAIMKYCKSDIVILLTQDAKLHNSLAMFNLVKDIDSKNIVYTFGRQLCLKKRCIERYIRDFNYPKESYIARKEKIEKYQIKAFFASDVFAALNRKVFLELKGYGGVDIPTNEDMLYMHKLLTNGYKAKYCADAMVEHYHQYSFKGLYKRYFDTGVFFKKMPVFNKYKKTDSGKKLAFHVLKEAFKHFDFASLFLWLPNMTVRYIAMKKGSK